MAYEIVSREFIVTTCNWADVRKKGSWFPLAQFRGPRSLEWAKSFIEERQKEEGELPPSES